MMATDLLKQELHLLNKEGFSDLSDNNDLKLHKLEQEIEAIPTLDLKKATLLLDCATQYLNFQRFDDAWKVAREIFDFFVDNKEWQLAVVACDIMVASDQEESLIALAHGVWLGITYPINPETTVAILQHLIDESPIGSETAAVSAVTAHYISDVRKPEGKAGESLTFFTHQVLAKVAAEHRNISSQQEFDIWMQGNEFDNPDSFLPKLSKAINSLVKEDQWWFDKQVLQNEIF